jgi:hypothetical protein
MYMVRHDLQREQVELHLGAERLEDALQPLRDGADQRRASVLRAPDDVVLVGVDDWAVRFVTVCQLSVLRAPGSSSTRRPVGNC